MDTATQCYYNNYRLHFVHPWAKQTINSSLNAIKKVDDEDRVTVCRKLASQTGFTGLSILHRLFYLYQFDILYDLVYDTMHTLILRVVYRHLHYYSEEGFFKNPVWRNACQLCHELQVCTCVDILLIIIMHHIIQWKFLCIISLLSHRTKGWKTARGNYKKNGLLEGRGVSKIYISCLRIRIGWNFT